MEVAVAVVKLQLQLQVHLRDELTEFRSMEAVSVIDARHLSF